MSDLYVPSDGLRRDGSGGNGSNRFGTLVSLALRPFVWLLKGARFVAFAAFAVVEPFVSLVLWGLSVLVIVSALILKAVGPPDFPFWEMMTFGLGCATLLALYYVVIRWLTPR